MTLSPSPALPAELTDSVRLATTLEGFLGDECIKTPDPFRHWLALQESRGPHLVALSPKAYLRDVRGH